MESRSPFSTINAWLKDLPIKDPVNRQMATLLQVMLLGFMAVILLAAITNLLISETVPWTTNLFRSAIVILIVGLPLIMLRRGYFQIPVVIIISIFFSLETAALQIGNLREVAETLSFYTLAIILAGLLLGRRALLLVFLACVGVVVFGAIQELNAGMGNDGAVIAGNFILLNGLVSVFLDRFRITLRTALTLALERERDLQREVGERIQATEALRESEERYRTLIDAARDVIFTLSLDGNITSLNPSFETFTGWSRDEWLGRSFEELVNEADSPQALEQFRRILGGETIRSFRLGVPTHSGATLVVEVNMSRLLKGDQQIGLLGIARDMTQEQRTEELLRASEKRFRALIEKSSDGIGLLSIDGKILYGSPALTTILGYTPDELVSHNAFDLLHSDDVDSVTVSFMRLLQSPGASVSAQYRYRHKDGSWRWLEAVGTNLLDDPNVNALVANYRDITERKQAEKELIASEEQFRDLFENAPIGIGVADHDGNLLAFNDAMLLPGNYSRGEIKELGNVGAFYYDPQERQTVMTLFQQQGFLRGHEVMLKRRDGSPYHVLLYLTSTHFNGQPAIQAIVEDITDRKRAEDNLRTADAKYRKLVEQLPIAMYMDQVDESGASVYISPQAEEMLGYSDVEFRENPLLWHKLIIPEDYDRAIETISKTIKNGRCVEEYRVLTRDGRIIWLRDTSVLVTDENGKQKYIQGFLEDITTRKLAEQETHKQAEAMKVLYETTRDLVIEQDLPKLLQTIVERATRLLNATGGGLYLCDAQKKQVRCVVSYNTLRDYTGQILNYGEGAAGRVAQTGKPLIIDDYSTWEGRAQTYEGEKPFRSVLSVPMSWQREIIGIIHVLEYDRERHFSESDLGLVQSFANQASIAVHNSKMYTNMQQHNRVLSALQDATLSLMEQYELSDVLQTILNQASQLMNTPHGYIYLLDSSEEEIKVILGNGVLSRYVGKKLKPGEGLAGKVWQGGDALYIQDYHAWQEHSNQFDEVELYAVVGVPLTSSGKVVGVLGLAHLDPANEFSSDDLELLVRFAQLASIAYEKARLYTLTQQELVERKQAQDALQQSEERYRSIFRTNGISIWEEDFSDVKTLLNELRMQGITDMRGYLREHPEIVRDAQQRLKVVDVNDKTLQLYKAKDKSELLNSTDKIFGLESIEPFTEELVALAENKSYLEGEATDRDLEGNLLHLWRTIVFPEDASRFKSSLVSITDITERKKAEEQINRQVERLKALREIDMAIASSTDLHLSLQTILKQTVSQLGVDAADVMLLNPATHYLEYSDGIGFLTKNARRVSFRIGEGPLGQLILDRKTVMIDNFRDEEFEFPQDPLIEKEEFVCYFSVPLTLKGQVKGLLEIFHRQPLTPGREWLDFLDTLAGQTSLAIDNATLFEGLRRSNFELTRAYETTLEGWSAALDLRDKETEGHTKRVTDLTLHLAEAMGMTERELVHVRRGALLHDIGKMGVPDRVLLKKGSLTNEEWEIMRRHPVYARDLLMPIEFLRPALDIPYCHHEKWDGTGYPNGLKGIQIPLAARIFAVTDVYDALISNRPYRPAWSREKTLKHIQELSGSHFDPEVVKAFLVLQEK